MSLDNLIPRSTSFLTVKKDTIFLFTHAEVLAEVMGWWPLSESHLLLAGAKRIHCRGKKSKEKHSESHSSYFLIQLNQGK